jgi:uncharacterized protein (TIGR03663 family)
LANPPPKIRWAIFIGIALLALAVRLPQLGGRPMHTDESINAYITGGLLAGEKYQYDPKDRHGPALYALAEPLARLAGAHNLAELTESELRITPVLAGAATVLLFGAAVEMFGFIACVTAALLFAFGSLPVYYSRYFIHETLFTGATLGLILSGWRMLNTHSASSAVATGFCAALMLACKETAVIHFFALGVAVAAGWRFVPKGILRKPRPLIIATLVFLGVTVLLFTWFGQNWTGLADLFRAIPNFAARAGGEGHEKSIGYYFQLLDTSLILFPLTVAGIYIAIWETVNRDRNDQPKPHLLLVIYGLVTLLIYSAIPYKTPWLALNIWLPLVLIDGLGVEAIWSLIKNPAGKWLAGIIATGFLAVMGVETQELVFEKPADEKNPYAYAHTTEDMLRLPGRLSELARQDHLDSPRIAVVAADAWPLPWYLRKFPQTGFWQPDQQPTPAEFYLTSTDVSTNLAGVLKDFRPEYFGWRPNVLLILWSPPATNMPAGHE